MTDPVETLWITDAEMIRRLGLPEKSARKALKEFCENSGFPPKVELWGNRRYWPAVKHWVELQKNNELPPKAGRKEPGPVPIGVVYFLASSTHIKIGFSGKSLKRRTGEIRQNHYEKLEILGFLDDVPKTLEK